MAIQLNMRTTIIAGVAVLALAGAGAWFFLFQEEPPPPPPPAVAAKPPAKPEAEAAKADAKPAAEAPKAAVADSKPVAAKPALKPIPTNPDQLIAEVIERSGLNSYFQTLGRETMLRAVAGYQSEQSNLGLTEAKQVIDAVDRAFESGKLTAELAAKLKGGFDAERMARFLELLRQPISLKMVAPEFRDATPDAAREHGESLRKNPPSDARAKLIQTLDDAMRTSEVGVDMENAIARSMVDGMLDAMQKARKKVSKEAREMVGSQLNAMRNQARGQIRAAMYLSYRNATDEELAEYVKLLDADTGRWGLEMLSRALRPALVSRGGAIGREVAPIAVAKLQVALAKASTEEQAAAKPEEEKTAKKPAAAPATAEPVGYQRPANIRELYTRYNDLMTAVVMRDRAAVKELLSDGKSPNVWQSDGSTPLMVAVSNGDADLAEMLLAKGADPNLRATTGATALSIAKERRRADLVGLLERNGAKN